MAEKIIKLEESKIVEYKDQKVIIAKEPKDGENLAVYARPGDKIEVKIPGFDMEEAETQLMGGDIIVTFPGGGKITFVSMALMSYDNKAPLFQGIEGIVTLDTVLSNIDEINNVPIEAVITNEKVEITTEAIADDGEPEEPVAPEVVQASIARIAEELAAKDTAKASKFTSDSEFDDAPVEAPEIIKIPFTDDNPPVAISPDNKPSEVEGVAPTLNFDIKIQHINVEQTEDVQGLVRELVVDGSGGVSYTNAYPNANAGVTELAKQLSPEIIDFSYLRESDYDKMTINADNENYIADGFTARRIELNPIQPEGYMLEKITLDGLPENFEIVNGIGSVSSEGIWTITREVLNANGTVGTPGFTVNEKTGAAEIIIRYSTTIVKDFELKIKAESTFNMANVSDENKDIIEEPIELYQTLDSDMTYGINVRNVNENNPNYIEVEGHEEGFVLATNLNDNIIKTGDLDTTVNGSDQKDTITAQSGDDVIYGKGDDDIIDAGSGDNTIDGGEGNNTITSGSGIDIITSGSGNDIVNAGSGNDIILVGEGNDTITLGRGDDIVNGGDGIDTLNFENSTSAINLDLRITTGQNTNEGTDTISNIEHIVGSNSSDTLIGNEKSNAILGNYGLDIISGKDGDDYLDGGGLHDTIAGGKGNDIIKGGEGEDTVSFADSDFEITVKLFDKASSDLYYPDKDHGYIDYDGVEGITSDDISAMPDGIVDNTKKEYDKYGISTGEGTDYIYDVENVLGSDHDDLIAGDAGDNTLDGAGGTNTVSYLDNESNSAVYVSLHDKIAENDGNDTLLNIQNVIGSNSDDTIKGDKEDNVLDAQGHSVSSGSVVEGKGDWIDYSYIQNQTIDVNGLKANGVNVNLTTTNAIVNNLNGDNEVGIDTILNFENIKGSSNDDILVGDNFNNTLDGSGGNDVVDYSYSGNQLFVNLTQNDITMNNTVIKSLTSLEDASVDTFVSIENIIGSETHDSIYGSSLGNILDGHLGNDFIDGQNGDDTIYGRAGNDHLISGNGNDFIDGGNESDNTSGSDTIDYSNSLDGVTLTLADSTTSTDNTVGTATATVGNFTDTVKNIEHIYGSNELDILTGNSENNTLLGAGGSDTLNGGEGNDTLYGGSFETNSLNSGNDLFIVSEGNDKIDGGDGANQQTIDSDTIDYSQWTKGSLNITLNGSLEASFSDIDDGVNDKIDKIYNIENIIGTNSADSITGDSEDNTLEGKDGDDYLDGLDGDDNLLGGLGNDIIRGGIGSNIINGGSATFTIDVKTIVETNTEVTSTYGFAIGAYNIYVDLALGVTHTEEDIFNLIITEFNDVHSVTPIADTTLAIENGHLIVTTKEKVSLNREEMSISGGDWIDYSNVSDSSITIDLSSTALQIITSEISDKIYSVENIEGGNSTSQGDLLTGDAGDNTIKGNAGDDSLVGGLGNDHLIGGVGSDRLNGGAGNDILDGGDTAGEVDTVDYSLANGDIYIDLSQGDIAVEVGSGFGKDTFKSIEGVIAGNGNDVLIGSNVSNTLIGGAGDDTLKGGGVESGGYDYLDGGADGANGDFVSFSDQVSLVKVDLSDTQRQNIGNLGEIQILNIENLEGSQASDILGGNTSNNIISGRTGDDTISSRGGKDILIGGDGSDTLDYSKDDDTDGSVGINIDLTVDKLQVLHDGQDSYKDTIYDIENIIGSKFGDTIKGADTSSLLLDNASTVMTKTLDGTDKLKLEILIKNGGTSTLKTLIFENGSTNVLNASAAVVTVLSVAFSSSAAKELIAEAINKSSETGDGSGVDPAVSTTAVLSSSEEDVGIFIKSTTSGDDLKATFTHIDSLTSAEISIENNATVNNTYIGGLGEDTIYGGAGDDLIYGSNSLNPNADGSNSLEGGAGNDIIHGGYLSDVLKGGSGNDTLYGYEGDDKFYGGAGNDTLEGGAGNDTFYVEFDDGEDTVDGGEGSDTIDYSALVATQDLTINLDGSTEVRATVAGETDTDSSNGVDQDKIKNVENVTGGAGNDNISGDSEVNVLKGGSGSDNLNGEGNDDILEGGIGIDNLIGGSGDDTLNGGGDFDTADYSDNISGEAISIDMGITQQVLDDGLSGSDTLVLIEKIKGSQDNDTIKLKKGDMLTTIDGHTGNADVVDLSQNVGLDSIVLDVTKTNKEITFSSDITDTYDIENVEKIVGTKGNDTFFVTEDETINNINGSDGTSDTIDYTKSSAGYRLDATLNGSSEFGLILNDGTTNSSDMVSNIENITGTNESDIINGDDNNNILLGANGNDKISGGLGDDTLNGNSHTATVEISSTTSMLSNVIDSTDTVTIKVGNDNITVENGNNVILVNGIDNGDRLAANFAEGTKIAQLVEAINNVSIFNTTYTASTNGHDDLNISLQTGLSIFSVEVSRNDVTNAETFSNGDTVDYTYLDTAGGSTGVIANLESKTANDITGGTQVGSDTVDGFEHVTGSKFDDTLIGDGADNILKGMAGNDTFAGGAGDDVFLGSTGRDVVDYSSVTESINVDISDGKKTVSANEGTDTFSDIEGVIGGTKNDILKGNNEANELQGRSGDDTLLGAGLTDVIDINAGRVDILDGGDGGETIGDFVSFSYTSSNVTVDLSITSNQDVNQDSTNDTQIIRVENLEGGSGNDLLIGKDDKNILRGISGNDTLIGGDGDDTLDGGINSQIINLGTINSIHNFDITNSTTTATIEVDNTSGIYTSNAELLNKLVELFNANSDATSLGSIVVSDGSLYIQTKETVNNSTGTITSGTYIDTADYSQLTTGTGIIVAMDGAGTDNDTVTQKGIVTNDGFGANDTLIEIENIKGSQYVDNIKGDEDDNVNNTFEGGAGADIISGGSGDDTLYGDYKTAGNATDNDADNLKGGSGNDTIYGQDGADIIDGGLDNDVIDGGSGNDTINTTSTDGVDGTDNIDGKTGLDTVDYSTLATGSNLKVNLDSSNSVNLTIDGGDTDTLTHIENVTGGAGNDTISGDDQINTLIGNNGVDVLNGEENDDKLYGGNNTDTLDGGTGNDLLDGGSADDILIGGAGNDTLDGGDDIDTANYSSSTSKIVLDMNDTSAEVSDDGMGNADDDNLIDIEKILGSKYNDDMTGNDDANIFEGQAGVDTLKGGAGNDTLTGGRGDDTTLDGGDGTDIIIGGQGADILVGGKGNDLLRGDGEYKIDVTSTNSALYTITVGGIDISYTAGNPASTTEVIDGLYEAFNANSTVRNLGSIDKDSSSLYITTYNDATTITINDTALLSAPNQDSSVDTADYTASTNSIIVDMSQVAQVTDDGYGNSDDDTLIDIEKIQGSTKADTFNHIGDGDIRQFSGGLENDTFNMDIENTNIDTINGEDGANDLVSYSAMTDAHYLDINLDNNGTEITSTIRLNSDDTVYATDKVSKIEDITGGAGRDTISGNDSTNTLQGLAGNDVLDGEGGADKLLGQDGNDLIKGGLGNDIIDGGNHSIDVNNNQGAGVPYTGGGDTVSYDYLTSSGQTVEVNLGTESGKENDGQGTLYTDTITNIENVIGGSNKDTITGNDTNNTLDGNSGNDTFYRSKGDDEINDSAGVDVVNYGVANGDTADTTTTQIITLSASGAVYTVTKQDGGTDTLTNIETVIGSDSADEMSGDTANDTFEG
ncbi:MAG TPA: hypothetical protein EYG97_04755, partial [Arcobacter sp.]|nr:hypothetical protein [Arcobacter sp.]